MKTISILFTFVISMSLTQFVFGDSHKGSKAKNKPNSEQAMHQRGKDKNRERKARNDDHDYDNDDHDENLDNRKDKGKKMREAKRNERASEAQERNAASKQVKDDYKSAVKNGETERVKGKKPWWKLWGSDSE